MNGIVHIDTEPEIRRRQKAEALEGERVFWMKTAMELQAMLDAIMDAAEDGSKVRIIQRGRVVNLLVAPEEKAKETPNFKG